MLSVAFLSTLDYGRYETLYKTIHSITNLSLQEIFATSSTFPIARS